MGMFDYVICDYPLPEFPPEALPADGPILWQTKNIDNILAYYHLTEEGRLIRTRHGHQASGRAVDIYFHGELVFYTVYDDEHKWLQYRATFEDGQLVDIQKDHVVIGW